MKTPSTPTTKRGKAKDPLKERMPGCTISIQDWGLRAVDSVSFLYIHGVLPHAEFKKAHKRIRRLIDAALAAPQAAAKERKAK